MPSLVIVHGKRTIPGSYCSLTVDQTSGGVPITLPAGVTLAKVEGAVIGVDNSSGIFRLLSAPRM